MGIGIILFLPVPVGGEGGREGENILIYKNRFRTIFIHCGIRFLWNPFFSACIVGFVCTFAKEWFAASRYCCRLGGCIVA